MYYDLVLKNSDKISFTEVITGVSMIMQIPVLQAEQLATLVHHRGAVTIKESIPEEMADQYYELFQSAGLPVEVVESE